MSVTPVEPTFTIKQRDRRKYLKATAYDSSGSVMDLTGLTAVFNMWKKSDKTVKVSRQAANITDAANGELEYRWQAGDTDEVGEFEGEFETLDSGNLPYTLPEDGYIQITITDDIA